MHQPIIPGLPDDLGLRCLAMLPHGYHGVMETVSKRWRDVMRSEEYASFKARQGWCGDWLFVLTEVWYVHKWVAYDPEADRWHPLPPLPSPDWHQDLPTMVKMKMRVLGCHCVYNKFLLIGGSYSFAIRKRARVKWNFRSNDMFQLDPFKKEWSRVTSMRTSRSDFASCTLDGNIYVAGGRNSDYREGMNLAEVYDPLADRWEDLPPMPVPMMTCIGIAYKGKFHVINVGADDRGLHQIQVFDPLSRSWHLKHENWSPSRNKVAVAGDQVYLMSVSGSTVELERRDAEKDECHIVGEVPPLFDPNNSEAHWRPEHGLASLGHELYVMGVTRKKDSEGMDKVDLGRASVCDPRCLALIWRETRPMCPSSSGVFAISCWASLKQQ